MQEKTILAFDTLRRAKERWRGWSGYQDALVRGSDGRRVIAQQVVRYRALLGTTDFLDLLRQSLDGADVKLVPKKVTERPVVLCSHCGKPLRAPLAQQCLECGADWHLRPTTDPS